MNAYVWSQSCKEYIGVTTIFGTLKFTLWRTAWQLGEWTNYIETTISKKTTIQKPVATTTTGTNITMTNGNFLHKSNINQTYI